MGTVTDNSVTLKMPNGTNRTFMVRPQDAQRLDLPHLRSHEGVTDVGFRVTYENVDGTDYLLTANETAAPKRS